MKKKPESANVEVKRKAGTCKVSDKIKDLENNKQNIIENVLKKSGRFRF